MGYCGFMGYAVHFPTHRGGGPKNVWDFGSYVSHDGPIVMGHLALTTTHQLRAQPAWPV